MLREETGACAEALVARSPNTVYVRLDGSHVLPASGQAWRHLALIVEEHRVLARRYLAMGVFFLFLAGGALAMLIGRMTEHGGQWAERGKLAIGMIAMVVMGAVSVQKALTLRRKARECEEKRTF